MDGQEKRLIGSQASNTLLVQAAKSQYVFVMTSSGNNALLLLTEILNLCQLKQGDQGIWRLAVSLLPSLGEAGQFKEQFIPSTAVVVLPLMPESYAVRIDTTHASEMEVTREVFSQRI